MLSNNENSMKKIIFILSILFLFSFNVLAQEPTAEPSPTPEPTLEPFNAPLFLSALLSLPSQPHFFCEWNNPVNAMGNPPVDNQPFQFKNASCSSDLISYINNPTTNAEYYLNKTFSYGDILVVIFFSIFLVYILLKAIFSFFFASKNV